MSNKYNNLKQLEEIKRGGITYIEDYKHYNIKRLLNATYGMEIIFTRRKKI